MSVYQWMLVCCLTVLSYVAVAEEDALATVQQQGGLAVVTGSDAAALARDLAKDGRWLVRVRVPADQLAATRLALADLIPIVTVRSAALPTTIADHTVNAVLLSNAASISDADARRLLCPGGQLLRIVDQTWQAERIPDDKRHGDWTHWAADAQGTGIVADTAVAPSNSLRWLDQSFAGTQIRTAAGVVVVAEKQYKPDPTKNHRIASMMGIDVYSGVPLWRGGKSLMQNRTESMRLGWVTSKHGVIFVPYGEMQHAQLRDLHTGALKQSYDAGLRFIYSGLKDEYLEPEMAKERLHQMGLDKSKRRVGRTSDKVTLLVLGDTLIQAYGRQLASLDIPSGKLHWQVETSEPISRVHASMDGKRLYLQESPYVGVGFARWGDNITSAVSAFAVADGQQLWRNTDMAKESISQLFEAEGKLFAYDQITNIKQYSIHHDEQGDLYALDPLSGKTLWHHARTNNRDSHKSMLNNAIFWQGSVWTFGSGGGLRRIKTDGSSTPDTTQQAGLMGGNQRCVRVSGSTNYLITGFTSWLAADGTRYQTGLSRGDCAMPNYAARGALLTVTDQVCSCYNGMRGQMALVPGFEIVPIAEDQRLSTPQALPIAAATKLPETALTRSWLPLPRFRFYYEHQHLGPLAAGDVFLRLDMLQRLVSAYADEAATGSPIWQQRLSGRIYAAPIIADGLLYVGTADGRVTAIDLATGALRWSFLAAPQEAELVIRGQLESRWPVHQMLLHNGGLHVAAGRHSEVDGGLWLWRLDPATGSVQRRVRIYTPMSKLGPEESTRSVRLRSERNVANRSVLLAGFHYNEKRDEIVLLSRWLWKSGSSASISMFWFPMHTRKDFKGSRRAGKPMDPTHPAQRSFAVDMDAWDGKVIDPLQVSKDRQDQAKTKK